MRLEYRSVLTPARGTNSEPAKPPVIRSTENNSQRIKGEIESQTGIVCASRFFLNVCFFESWSDFVQMILLKGCCTPWSIQVDAQQFLYRIKPPCTRCRMVLLINVEYLLYIQQTV